MTLFNLCMCDTFALLTDTLSSHTSYNMSGLVWDAIQLS